MSGALSRRLRLVRRLLAGAVAARVPVLVLYFLLQRYYIQGISTTGLKT